MKDLQMRPVWIYKTGPKPNDKDSHKRRRYILKVEADTGGTGPHAKKYQDCWWPPEVRREAENGFCLKPCRRNQPANNLILHHWSPVLLSIYCFLKSASLWCFVIAAIENKYSIMGICVHPTEEMSHSMRCCEVTFLGTTLPATFRHIPPNIKWESRESQHKLSTYSIPDTT